MGHLSLQYEKELKGRFGLQKLNLLFVFQVNCPGCFIYGFPTVNQLYQCFGKDMGFLGLSTAFEDFGYNTEENTSLLLQHGQTVGETKKMLEGQGLDRYSEPIDFPIAMDKKADGNFNFEQAAEQVCESISYHKSLTKIDAITFQKGIERYLKGLEQISLTFTLNQMQGTPTFLLFDEAYTIVYHHFGHINYRAIKHQIELLLDTNR